MKKWGDLFKCFSNRLDSDDRILGHSVITIAHIAIFQTLFKPFKMFAMNRLLKKDDARSNLKTINVIFTSYELKHDTSVSIKETSDVSFLKILEHTTPILS